MKNCLPMPTSTGLPARPAARAALLLLAAVALPGCRQQPAAPAPSGAAAGPAAGTAAPAAQKTAAIDWNTAGSISGTIRFAKKAPPAVAIDMAQDPVCSLAPGNMSEEYVVSHGGLGNVFVYIKSGLGDAVYAPSREPARIDQQGCRYVPHVVGVMVGQPVLFTNSDATRHEVHLAAESTGSTPGGNAAFSISQQPRQNPATRVFSRPELMIPVHCIYHPWMTGYLNVASNPFFAVTDGEGRFEIRGLPPGTYTVEAVHEQLGAKTATVTVLSRQDSPLEMRF